MAVVGSGHKGRERERDRELIGDVLKGKMGWKFWQTILKG